MKDKIEKLLYEHGFQLSPFGHFAKDDFTTPESSTNFEHEWINLDPFDNLHYFNLSCVFDRFDIGYHEIENSILLDVGCGNGRLGQYLSELAKLYVGLEPSDAARIAAKEKCRAEKSIIVQSHLEDIPPNLKFDTVVCWGVLHHVASPKILFNRMIDFLAEDGTLLIYVYPKFLDERGNFSKIISRSSIEVKEKYASFSSRLVDLFGVYGDNYANLIASSLFLGRYTDERLQKFQTFDGVSPVYHWSLSEEISDWAKELGYQPMCTAPGCFKITKDL